jgi:hypothetical protein
VRIPDGTWLLDLHWLQGSLAQQPLGGPEAMRSSRAIRVLAQLAFVIAAAGATGCARRLVVARLGVPTAPTAPTPDQQACTDPGVGGCNDHSNQDDLRLNAWQQPPAANPTYLTADAVLSLIEPSAQGASRENTVGGIVSWDRFSKATRQGPRLASPHRPIWIVSAHVATHGDGGHGRSLKTVKVYSAVIDAESGQTVEDCFGCDWAGALGLTTLPTS